MRSTLRVRSTVLGRTPVFSRYKNPRRWDDIYALDDLACQSARRDVSGGGAAGYELDRADPALGSPDNIAIIACSENHIDTYVAVPEELLTHVSTVTGEAPEDLIRADMIYYETPAGGAVYSSSSITFCGSLPHNGFDNNISKLLLNVVSRFLS